MRNYGIFIQSGVTSGYKCQKTSALSKCENKASGKVLLLLIPWLSPDPQEYKNSYLRLR
jgi:hypothetical protein